MTELLKLQDKFHRFLLTGQSGIQDLIVPGEQVSVDTRLGIYRDAYKLRLIESLTTTYPALYAYLGTEEFNILSSYYIDAHPSPFRSIRWYGHVMSEFIASNYKHYPYLAELADFEWNMSLAFDAAEDPLLQIEDMAVIPPESWANISFSLHPSVQRRHYFWNSVPLWQALSHDKDLPELQCQPKSTSWILWRTSERMIQFYSLSDEEAWALENLAEGQSFGALCEGLCQWINPEEVGMTAASYLKGWIQNGMLSKTVIE